VSPSLASASAEPAETTGPPAARLQISCYRDDGSESVYDNYRDAWVTHFEMCDADQIAGPLTAREKTALKLAYDGEPMLGPAAAAANLYAICATTAPAAFTNLQPSMSALFAGEYLGAFSLCPDHPMHPRFLRASAIREERTARIRAQKENRRELQALLKYGRAFYDGTYRVGKDLQPGTYYVHTDGSGCYWERNSPTGAIIANNFSYGLRAQVTIAASDYSFTSSDCGLWRPVQ